MNLLVTSISRKVPLLEAAAAALARRGDGRLFGGDSDAGCVGRFFVDRFWQMPPLEQLTPEQLLDYCHANEVGALMPTRDGELPFFAAVRERLAEEGISVMVSSTDSLARCQDKLAFAAYLCEEGLPAIPTATAPPTTGAVMVKPRFGAGGCGASGPLTPDAAAEFGKALCDPIYQPFIEGTEFSIDLYRDRAGEVKGALARERVSVLKGESQVTRSRYMPELEELCEVAAGVLGLYGHAVFQALVDGGGKSWLIECNPRVGGASTLAFTMGLDSIDWFLHEAAGERLDDLLFNRAQREYILVRYPKDLVR